MSDEASDAVVGGDIGGLLVRFCLVLVGVVVVGGAAAYFLRPSAESAAHAFVDRFGVGGMALGTFLADGLQFPVPPQFYMLLAIASQTPVWKAFAAIAGASVLAGIVGYFISERLSHVGWVSRKTARVRHLLTSSFARRGYWAALLASVLPVPFSMLCYLAGLNRMPLRFLALLMLLRVPKLAAFYSLLHLGWSLV